jgi:glucokinase
MILVGDVGGTHTRLALVSAGDGEIRIEKQSVGATQEDLCALIRAYLDANNAGAVSAVALCGAGPKRDDGSIHLTNHSCVLDPGAIAAATGTSRVTVVNDFEAVVHAIPVLKPEELMQCGGGASAAHASRLAIGAGTGLGIAALVPAHDDWIAVPGEGGHADLAPVDDEELVVWQALRRTRGRVSAETVLSGPGLERLYAAVGGMRRLLGPEIATAARDGDPHAQQSIRLFTRWLGRVAGNVALTLAARGGVYIAGGIVPAWGVSFDVASFRAGFDNKAPFSDWLARIPAFVILHPQPALLGLARLAQASLSGSSIVQAKKI